MRKQEADELRQFKRVAHSQPVHYQGSEQADFGGCISKDISEGGVRIRLNDFVPLNTELTLNVHLSGGKVVECTGRVIWIEKARFGDYYQAGLKFIDVDTVFNDQHEIAEFLSGQKQLKGANSSDG